ncbi:MAG: type IV toxin-antitoxin system AbiEi family antitoxin domain-containing protein [Spirochaetales bacterium]|uniref:Type IV toxin-antitoxin system AbiEi family antitoxin domain-containing protein n=1 Tax=Candidatus Thalassospirochaeta sargassi TaxID=3119039 RepID=A0AAJ1IJZ5_9SPIO|nr:type IV toxin-antitoxin system AbiEi family antitoxin domain-containing protein [Spirochaetales bacterium]
MKQNTREKILEIFRQQSGYVRTRDIKEQGIHHSHLKELQGDGTIIKVKHGLFSLTENSQYSSLIESQLSIPDGIICMGSALSFYDLTTWDPPDIHIAIPKSRKVKTPDYPPVKLFYFSGEFYKTGITTEKLDSGETIQIYDREKTICDVIRFRNKIGIDIMKEALGEYIKSKEKNLNKLNSYAKNLKISSVLRQYLEVLI